MSEVDEIIRERTGSVLLKDVCHWFGLGWEAARNKAAAQDLPIPVFKGKSAKSPWMVKIDDLATYVESQYAEHKKDFDEVNAA